jgi:hypothetical protein
MHTHRFGRKLKLPSTIAIKHGILKLMLLDELKAQAPAAQTAEDVVARSRGAEEGELNVVGT